MAKIVVLTEGKTDPLSAKTATSLIRYRTGEVVAILDSTQAGRTSDDLLGVGGNLPVVASLDAIQPQPDTLVIGIVNPGGVLPEAWRQTIGAALAKGMDVVSGLHVFLSDDPEFSKLAEEHGGTLVDVRKNQSKQVAQRLNVRPDCFRIHTVGNDCNVGKMVTAIEIARAFQAQNIDAKFVATGQTGIMIEGDGCPIDCVVSDFVNGAAEQLVLANQKHDVLVIEGQGSLAHPRFSSVTLGLLHGSMPHALVLCYEAGRTRIRGMDHLALPSLRQTMHLNETMAAAAQRCVFVGVSMNSRKLSTTEANVERQRVRAEFGLPVCDVIRHGPQELIEAIEAFRQNSSWKEG